MIPCFMKRSTTSIGLFVMMACLFDQSKLFGDDGVLAPFMGAPELKVQQVFKGQRFPNITVATDGSVLASWGAMEFK